MLGLKGRVAFVTGAAGGIGRAICQRFVDEGIDVVAADIDADALRKMSGELSGCAAKLLPMILDITDFQAVERTITDVVKTFGRIDILVNNAGWVVAKPFLETSPDFWDKVIAINLKGPLNLHRVIVPHMVAAGRGKVINIASDAGRVGSTGESVYSACKGGLISFTKSLARECARQNVHLNAVCPGPTDTQLLRSFVGEGDYGQKLYEKLKKAIPLKRLGQPGDLPGIIAFLSSDDADFITGQVISVSGGLTMHG
ncbi:MAG: 2-hydroxycyclohexanecarboxyl-CoA dehydrogenase [Verrucomicrobiota bacterium]